jgi:hypothetical protein
MLPLVFETHRQEQEHETSRKVESEWVSEWGWPELINARSHSLYINVRLRAQGETPWQSGGGFSILPTEDFER